MLVLEVLMGLKYKQGYVASEFIHVDVDKGEISMWKHQGVLSRIEIMEIIIYLY